MAIPKDSPAGREQFATCMEVRRKSDAREEADLIERGWCLGSDAFRQELLAQVDEFASPSAHSVLTPIRPGPFSLTATPRNGRTG